MSVLGLENRVQLSDVMSGEILIKGEWFFSLGEEVESNIWTMSSFIKSKICQYSF